MLGVINSKLLRSFEKSGYWIVLLLQQLPLRVKSKSGAPSPGFAEKAKQLTPAEFRKPRSLLPQFDCE
jgi:hypothetical protein